MTAPKAKAVATVPIPPKMRLLGKDRRGYPVPFIVQRDLTNRAFFTVNDMVRVLACGRRGLCGICGTKLERDVWLIGGPGAAFHEHGAYLDPPMHHACATYALMVCPYLGSRYSGRIDQALLKHGKWPPMKVFSEDLMMPEQPPFFVLARTRLSRMVQDPEEGNVRFHPQRPWLAVELWIHGRQVSEAEATAALAAAEGWPWTPADLMHWQAPAAG